ncbi:hypothetical protein B0A48_15487 [Cryoendolithus antarcticus]|uniref:ABC transporter domain-containing protein n=1 Tax=Cryoendolithus antarcticus TaxID=1507870 RepID=A0A1V8SH94_9PEZI|nr:hypothetical protein B0A48_15487 [Cryoendolithus antarcticus]
MAFFRQTWTLIDKNLTIILYRNWLGTIIRAFLAPVIFFFFISYAKNFFVPPSDFGVGSARSLRSLGNAIASSAGGRNTVVFVDNGHTGGQISQVISQLSRPIESQGKAVQIVDNDIALLSFCRSSIRGTTPCFGAISFHSSPTEGTAGFWNYTMRLDGSFGGRVYVNSGTNDAEIYALPLQHAVDAAIAGLNGTTLPDNVEEYPYTSQTNEERARNITRLYMGSLISVLAVAYFVGIVGVCYQLTGQMAQERELGMSQLIEAMMSNKARWQPQAARLLSMHISFDMLYLPSWILGGAIVARLNYPDSMAGISIGYFIVAGLALSSWSIAVASLFRKAQLSGITTTIVSIILAIIVQVVPPTSTGAAAILALLFPPMNFTLFIIYMAYFQKKNLAADLSQSPPGAPWQVPGYAFFIFCIIQMLVYPIVGAFIERALYGTASKARTLHYNEDSNNETVRVTGLKKYFPQSWFYRTITSRFSKTPRSTVRAVDDVSFSVLRGQIMVLLGANGSGKSTSLDMLAGLQKPTDGSIDIDATGGIGLCPQKNVLWDELTVLEHVRIFNRLKATTVDSKDTMQALVRTCDLDHKMNAKSVTLSGGQKRKCQLAMMLTGGSTTCLIDEVSSGIDPLSRRKVWDIILAERGRRSMILTTHFLDEADLLSDDITILSKGRLVANGSSVALKHELGGGYRVRIYHEDSKPLPAALEALPKQVLHDQTVYQLANSGAAAQFVSELEKVGVRDYQVNGPTIEDVFLKLAEEVKEELDKDVRAPISPVSSTEQVTPTEKGGIQLAHGRSLSFFAQVWVLFRKRVVILRRNSLPYLAALAIPIIAGALVTLFLKGFEALTCTPGSGVSASDLYSLEALILSRGNATIPAGPPGSVGQFEGLVSVDSLRSFDDYVSANYSQTNPGGFFLGNTPTFAYRGNYELYYAIIMQNLFDTSLLGFPISTNFQAFDIPFAPSAGKSLQFILYFGLAMCAYPGFFSLYTNIERIRNVRALHYSNGVRAGPLWIAYTLFDFCIVLIVSAVTIIIFTASSSALYAPGYLFVVFAFYGLSALLMSYVVSLFATSQLATFAFAAGGQCCFFLIYFIAYLCIQTYIPAASVDKTVNIAHFVIAAFFPAGNLLRALLLTFNEFSILCRGNEIASYPGAMTVYGGPILYLILQSAIMLGFLIWWGSGWQPAFLTRRKARAQEVEETEEVDPEVFDEARRADTCSDSLRVLHATKAFGSNIAVQDVTFAVPEGEVFALLGPNGAGKSTTIGLIRGDSRPSARSSDILIEGKSIIAQRAAARQSLGVCPQFDAMDQMTAVEHLRFYARARGIKDVEHNVEQVIHAVGLAPFKSRMAAKLSGGNKRKLSLGIALIGNPTVLLLDEPSSGMDAASKRVMWRTLSSISAGRALVLTTHSMEEADALASRAGIMARRMLALGTSDDLRKKHGDAYHVHLVHKDAPHTSTAVMDDIKTFISQTFPSAQTEDRSFHGQMRFSVPNDRTAVYNDDEVKVVGAKGHGIAALFAELERSKERLGFEYYSVSQATLDQVFLSIVTRHNVQEEGAALTQPKKKGFVKRMLRSKA